MLNLTTVELFKLRKSFSYKMLLLGQFMICFIFLWMFFCNMKNPNPVTGDAFFINGYDALFMSVGQVQQNAIFTSIFAALFICSEFTNRTLLLPIATGRKRVEVFLSKATAFVLGVIGIIMIMPIVMTVAMTLLNGFGREITGALVIELVKVLVVYLLLNTSVACISLLIAYTVRNVGATIGISMGITVGMSVLTQARFGVEHIVGKLLRWTPFWQSNEIVRENSATTLFFAGSVGIGTMVVMLMVTYYLFRRADLQ